MTGDAAVRGIRKIDTEGTIGMISAEPDPPYDRPPLSKGLWKGKKLESIWRNTESLGAKLILGRRIVAVNPDTQTVIDDQEVNYTWEKLLLATGATPRRFPSGNGLTNYFRTLEDYRQLRADTEQRQSFVVIGGGFIGSELAAALAMNGKEVTIIVPEKGLCARLFPEDLSLFLNEFYRLKGVSVMAETVVTDMSLQNGKTIVKAEGQAGGQSLEVDAVVAGLGVTPNVDLAMKAGLEVDNGIVVNEYLEASDPSIFAAGDVAFFYNPALGKRIRVEHEDNAKAMGRIAGQNMAGEKVAYHHLPFFYSDLFELGYEAVGELDSRLQTVSDWKEPYKEGVVYYLGEGRVRGVLLWNLWSQVDAARRLIAEPGPFERQDLIHRLPEGER